MGSRIDGEAALVTAAGNGIGRAIAEAFVAEGADVLALDIDATAVGSLSGVDIAVVDVTDRRALEEAIGGRAFTIVANCVGWVHHGSILECDLNSWKRSFTLNVDSMYYTIQSVLPQMIAIGGGSIINIASVASSLKGFPNRVAYGATKAAIIGLTKAIAVDHLGQNVRCNAICPGVIDSPSLAQRISDTGKSMDGGARAARAEFIARQPIGRFGTPAEVASLAVYLASHESDFTTGQSHVIDGGILS